MAPPEPEWLLWAKRFQDEHKALLLRIDGLAQATSKIGSLVDQTKDLATSTGYLQRENNLLIEKTSLLERDNSKQGDAIGIEIKVLRERVGDLERDLHRTIGSMEERRLKSRCPHDGKERNVTIPRTQVAFATVNLRSRAAAPRTISQATTTDESTPAIEEAEVKSRYASREVLSMDPQGEMALEAYFKHGEASVTKAVQLYEKRAVKAFVTGLAAKSLRLSLWERLDEVGWTWQKAREEIHKTLKAGRRRSKRIMGSLPKGLKP